MINEFRKVRICALRQLDDKVAAIIDFCPPGVGALAHDISRIGCDPRTVLRLADAWPAALATLAITYREHNPTIGAADVVGCVRWWIRYTAASMYPLRTLLAGGPSADADLAGYARQRHHAQMAVLDLADEAEALLDRPCRLLSHRGPAAIEGARSTPTSLRALWTIPGHMAQSGPLTNSVGHIVDDARQSVTCPTFNFQPTSAVWITLGRAAHRPS